MTITTGDLQLLAQSISGYRMQAFRGAKRIWNEGLVDPEVEFMNITNNEEGFSGRVRWEEYTDSQINTGNQTSDEGTFNDIETKAGTYIKVFATTGWKEFNISKTIGNYDVMSTVGTRLSDRMNDDRNGALVATLNSIASYEASVAGAANLGQTDPDSDQEESVSGTGVLSTRTVATTSRGFFVDLNSGSATTHVQQHAGTSGKLVDLSKTNLADKLKPLLGVMQIAFSDYTDDDNYILIVNPSTALELKQAELFDFRTMSESNVRLSNILQAQVRIVVTKQAFRNVSGATGVNSDSVKTSFLCKAGAFGMREFPVIEPIEIERLPLQGRFAGANAIVSRWSYSLSPKGYAWVGDTSDFVLVGATNNTAKSNYYQGDGTRFLHDTTAVATGKYESNWRSVYKNPYKMILPIFHK